MASYREKTAVRGPFLTLLMVSSVMYKTTLTQLEGLIGCLCVYPYRWKFIQVGNARYQDMDRLVAYEKALTTWAKWVETNVDTAKTTVFFQGISPDHMK